MRYSCLNCGTTLESATCVASKFCNEGCLEQYYGHGLKNKVYCSKCKYFQQQYRSQICKKSKYTVDLPDRQSVRYEKCSSLNANNDCKNYVKKQRFSFFKKKPAPVKPIDDRFEILDL